MGGIWQHEGKVENTSCWWVFSTFLECSHMSGVFYHSVIRGLGFFIIWIWWYRSNVAKTIKHTYSYQSEHAPGPTVSTCIFIYNPECIVFCYQYHTHDQLTETWKIFWPEYPSGRRSFGSWGSSLVAYWYKNLSLTTCGSFAPNKICTVWVCAHFFLVCPSPSLWPSFPPLRIVPTIVSAHTFCASRKTWFKRAGVDIDAINYATN